MSDTVATTASKNLLSKVPEITALFWIIKILCTTVGETAADYLNFNLNLGLGLTSLIMSGLLIVILGVQFALRRYVPGVYWLVVVFISVVGTLITDTMTDSIGVPLFVSTIVFAVVLAAVFAIWFAREHTLSIHSITSRPREAFYWLVVLVTFALGTAAGDLIAEQLKLGYALSLVLFGAMIAIVYALHRFKVFGPVLLFWIAYVLTRPLGASFGDLLSQPQTSGGLGIGTTLTSGIFLVLILGLVGYLGYTRRDVIREGSSV